MQYKPSRKEVAARKKYEQDLARHAATVARHARALADAAPKRIARANKAVERANAGGDVDQRYHAVERMLHEEAFYPPHDKRKESPLYHKAHDQLVNELDRPCLVCGVTHSTLGDPARNPFGAVQMETHHHVIEWALANAIDPGKFNERILPGLLRHDPAKYQEFEHSGMSKDAIVQWVDHDEDNLWVLCDVHHRHKFVGIHAITYPIWGPQDIVDETLVKEQIKLSKGIGKPAARTARPKRRKKAAKK